MGEGMMLHRIGQRIPKFTYTGDYEVLDDGHGNWRIKFLTSGTLTFFNSISKGIDVFLVGGGGGGASWVSTMAASASGGSGYTETYTEVSVSKGTEYPITVGAGGAGRGRSGTGSGGTSGDDGEDTTAFGYTASGGKCGEASFTSLPDTNYNSGYGGDGGSGGGAGGSGVGGIDGGNGTKSGVERGYGGNGQDKTTREFGEPDGDLYAQGGGADTVAVANSGNGGYRSNNGSSGIVVIRNHRE